MHINKVKSPQHAGLPVGLHLNIEQRRLAAPPLHAALDRRHGEKPARVSGDQRRVKSSKPMHTGLTWIVSRRGMSDAAGMSIVTSWSKRPILANVVSSNFTPAASAVAQV